MKNRYMVAALATLSLASVGCQDFLEEDCKTGEMADIVYATKGGIDGLVADCYSFARGWYGKEAGLGLSEMGTDLFYYGYDNKQKSLCSYNITPDALDGNNSDNACLDHYWEIFFCAVDVCNLAYQHTGSHPLLDNATKEQYLGEARFLRAFYYFHMVNIWGAVPFNDAPITAQNLSPVRMPEAELYGHILADLDESIAHFEAANYKKKTDGRANYWAARALKARVLVYAASWLNGQLGQQVAANEKYASMSGTQLYQAAQAEAEAVIGASEYASLYADYKDVWSMKNEAYQDNSEALFGITYSSDLKTTANCIPKRYKTNDSGSAMDYCSLITRTGYSRGGSAMLLMFVSMWNNGASDLGGNGTKTNCVFVRPTGESTFYIESKNTGNKVDVSAAYSPYGRGFTRYLPTLHLWNLLEKNRATDQRVEGTLLTHYDIASPELAGNASNYPNLADTAIYYCPLDGDSPAGKAQQAWAKDRYRIQFRHGGDIPVYTSADEATALPTEAGKTTSAVYADKRYDTFKIGGWCSFPGITKFLDNVFDPSYPTHDISSRDAIVMRLSEMYLIKAECQVAAGGDALGTLNELRAARAIAGKDNSLSGTVDIDVVLEERALELCGEQMRWFDLKRTGKLYEYVAKYNAQASSNLAADASKHYLYRPIPQTEIDAVQNLGNGFSQNPGY